MARRIPSRSQGMRRRSEAAVNIERSGGHSREPTHLAHRRTATTCRRAGAPVPCRIARPTARRQTSAAHADQRQPSDASHPTAGPRDSASVIPPALPRGVSR
jgi:hypothetical protein